MASSSARLQTPDTRANTAPAKGPRGQQTPGKTVSSCCSRFPFFFFFPFLFKGDFKSLWIWFPRSAGFLGSSCSSDRVFGVNGFGLWSIPRGKLDEVCRRSWRFSLLPEMKVLVVTWWTLRDCLFGVKESLWAKVCFSRGSYAAWRMFSGFWKVLDQSFLTALIGHPC